MTIRHSLVAPVSVVLCLSCSPLSAAGFKDRLSADVTTAEAAVAAATQRLKEGPEAELAKIWKQMEALGGSGDAVKTLDRQAREANAALKKLSPDKVQTRAELTQIDDLLQQRATAEAALKRALAERRAELRKLAAGSEEGKRLLSELALAEGKVAQALLEQETATAQLRAARAHLSGYTASLPPPDEKLRAKNGFLTIQPPPDAVERAQRFATRNSPENLAALAREFFARVDIQSPGLEKARAALAAGRPAEALEAWRDLFFAKFREPQKYGMPDNWGGELDTASRLHLPDLKTLDEAMRGIFSTPRAKAQVGAPGTINWGDPGPDPNADPENNPYLDFYTTRGERGFVDLLGPQLELLNGYAATGEQRYLDRWAEVADDWAMNAPTDMERSPFNIRQYTILSSFRPVTFASTLCDVQAAQPDFARSLPAPTLARVMLAAMEEYTAAFVRGTRRGIYNFRCMAMPGSVMTAQIFPEFQAARWQLGEAKRLMEQNWTHKILRDGGNLEQANWGHEPNDQVHLGRAYRLLEHQPPAWMDAAWRAEWLDNMKVNARYYLHTLKPDGFSYRFGREFTADKFRLRDRFDDAELPIQSNLLLAEPESRRRLEWVFGKDGTEPPRVASESLAYFGAAMLRGGWQRNASFLYFQSSPNRDANGREDANGFALHAHGHELLLAPPFAVDDRTQNIHFGMVPNPGGKTLWLSYDDRDRPVGARFHASERFDFTEGEYRGVYQLHTSKADSDVFDDYGYNRLGDKLRAQGDEPIRDVTHARQVISVRGEDVVIVTDRYRSDTERKFSQNYTLLLPVPREGWKRRVELMREEHRPPLVADAAAKTLRTDNHTLPGLSVRYFGNVQPTFTVTEDAFTRMGGAVTSDEALEKIGGSKLKKWAYGLPLPFYQKVRADWQSRGEQVLVTAIATRPGDHEAAPFTGDLRDVESVNANGVSGFRATTRNGTRIEYLTGAKPVNTLRAGPLAVEAEALLLVTGKMGTSGLVLGAKRLTQGGKALAAAGDFEFTISDKGLTGQPIHRPIQPVAIVPAATVFAETQRIELSCPTPGVEIRYTLDGSDPTIQSQLYRAPFTLTATTRIKARAFRPGLAETPWTADGIQATPVTWTTFEKQAPQPAVANPGAPLNSGLAWEYLEGRWPQLLAYGAQLPAIKTGSAPALLDVSMRATGGAFTVRSGGFIDVPADGVYTFYAPHEWVFPDGESGYDLRLFIHDQEWQPATRRHGQGAWSVALKKGLHPLRLVFTDFRPRKLKTEMWGAFPNPAVVWKGTLPTVEVSGPGVARRPLPIDWLRHL